MRYWLWVLPKHLLESIGYWIRPYDMLADRRRWWWQPAQRCGLPPMAPAARVEFMAAVEKMVRPDGPRST